jgi:NADH:ubiquinone oxidoreductase subunit F (NADH-binding)
MTARLLHGVREDRPLTLAEHVSAHGRLPARSRAALLEAVESSGLRGRGGAHVSAGMKLRAVAGRRGRAIVVANGAESEPASRKDAVLLASAPHLVLDGAAVAAAAVSADEAILYVKRAGGRAYAAVAEAIAERDRREGVAFTLVEAPATYVAGQETAAVAHLNRRRAVPTTVPPRPFERGVGRRPTLVSNVETLAHMALIARYGPEWFRQVGSSAQPGTALLTLSGAVERPGVYEAAFGTPMSEVLRAAGGMTEPAQALLVGGYGGTWVPGEHLESVRLDEGDPLLVRGSIGAGVLVVLGESACGLRESARVLDYLAAQSAGQCGPCVHGLRAIADAFGAVAEGRGDDSVEARLFRWADQVSGRGACRHPDGAARFVVSALSVFADELDLHAAGRCRGDRRAVLPIPGRVPVATG